MKELIETIVSIFNFRLWTDNLPFFSVTLSREQKAEFSDAFKGSLQKTFVLALLALGCSQTFNGTKFYSSAPNLLGPIVFFGFALFLLVSAIIHIWYRDTNQTRYLTNLLIFHVTLTLCMMLFLNLTGVSGKILSKMIKSWSENLNGVDDVQTIKMYSAALIAAIPSFLVTLYLMINSKKYIHFWYVFMFIFTIVLCASFISAKLPELPLYAPTT